MSRLDGSTRLWLMGFVVCMGLFGNAFAGDLSVDGVVRSETGGFEFPDGTLQTSAAATCSTKIRFVTLRAPVDMGGQSEQIVLTDSETVHWLSSHYSANTGELNMIFFFDDDFNWEYGISRRLDVFPVSFKGPLTFWLEKDEGSDVIGMTTLKITEECP